MAPTPLTLPVGATENSVRVHPVVLFTITDAFIRRNQGQERVIGTLLGSISDGVVEVKNCYAVPHSESNEQVALDVQHHQTMAQLQHRVSPRDKIVGWFSTGDPDASRSRDALIHSFYGNECPNPVHLALDTSGQGGRMGVRAFVSRALGLGGNELAREFLEVECEVRSADVERIGVDVLSSELQDKLPGDMEGLAESFERLQHSLQQAQAYVDAVVAGKQKGNTAVGRYLAETVAAVPHFTKADFEKMLADQSNDCTLVLFLSKLIQAHLALADKLGTMQLPLL
ncbi:hypothetical protein COHA_000799 [Chlorella ohadii]|uniref:Eukaryotic translation initiation factor 3 subunit F n=1 Tax=Chlorella ohadii TaxID=2649997 RepID=A0AAD5E0E9_9CHLO|nr:hypothetical protein COHA_000799 [Chlorella ohadii]